MSDNLKNDILNRITSSTQNQQNNKNDNVNLKPAQTSKYSKQSFSIKPPQNLNESNNPTNEND